MVLDTINENDELIFKNTHRNHTKYTLQANDSTAPDGFYFIHIEPKNNQIIGASTSSLASSSAQTNQPTETRHLQFVSYSSLNRPIISPFSPPLSDKRHRNRRMQSPRNSQTCSKRHGSPLNPRARSVARGDELLRRGGLNPIYHHARRQFHYRAHH